MDKPFAILTIGILCWIAAKVYGLGTWSWEVSNQVGSLINLGFMTAIAARAAYTSFQNGTKHFLDHWKEAAKPSVFFAFLLTAVMGSWYYVAAPGTIAQRKAQQIEVISDFFNDPQSFEAFVAEHPEFKGKDPNQMLSTQIENIDIYFSPLFYLGIAMMTWIFTGMLLAACFTLLIPRIWK